jgi:hypothetical protein
MATQFPDRPAGGMFERIKRILLTPKTEWPVIDAEPASVGGLMRNWVVPLAAIGPAAGLIGSLLFGHSALGITFRPSLVGVAVSAVIAYAVSLACTFALALIIDALAPSFGGTRNRTQAMKVAAYASTAAFLAGISQIVPALGLLGIFGLYSLYLMYLGLPVLMKSPADRAVPYTLMACVAAIVLFLGAGALTAAFATIVTPRDYLTDTTAGTLSIPGVGEVDTGRLQEASKQLEQASDRAKRAAESGTTTVVAPAALQKLLPETIGKWKRTTLEGNSASAGGIGGSRAEGLYVLDGHQVRLSVSDMSAMGALVELGSALKIESSKQTEDSYEKVGTVDGRLTTEKWNGRTSEGTYSQVVGGRFLVEAEGSAPDMLSLMSLVRKVDVDWMETMAK